MRRIYAATGAAAIVAAGAAAVWFLVLPAPDDRFAGCRQGAVAGGEAMIGGPFTLVDQTGRTVTDAEVVTRPSLIYFGYTYCPDVCPLDTARNAEAVEILEEMGKIVTPVFISIDPKRDTPEVLAEFAANLHPRMIALTGSQTQIDAASKAYRTFYRVQDGDPDYYLIDHTTFTYLVLPGHGFVEFFRRDAGPEEIARRVACFVDAS
ncbi:MAG: SCO family protein [Gemmobacter sp.]